MAQKRNSCILCKGKGRWVDGTICHCAAGKKAFKKTSDLPFTAKQAEAVLRYKCPVCKDKKIISCGNGKPTVACSYCSSSTSKRLTPMQQFRLAQGIAPLMMKLFGSSEIKKSTALPVPEILEEMAKTFRARNKIYGDNFRMVGRVMEVLFPNGVQLRSAADYDVWHLFELKIVKLTRFAISGLTHVDSIHDDSVYGAMIEAILKERKHNTDPHGLGSVVPYKERKPIIKRSKHGRKRKT